MSKYKMWIKWDKEPPITMNNLLAENDIELNDIDGNDVYLNVIKYIKILNICLFQNINFMNMKYAFVCVKWGKILTLNDILNKIN